MPAPAAQIPAPDPRCASKAGRLLELAILFGGIPALLATRWLRVPLLPLLWSASLYCGWKVYLQGGRSLPALRWPRPGPGEWRRVLGTFALVTSLLLAAVWALRPGALFAFPLHRPWHWILLLVLYPPLSVLPQEVIYRAFFFNRYQFLFGNGKWLQLGSACAFGITHLAFHNWVAVALTLPGGFLFAHSYRRNRGLLFVVCEHALYGCMVFTIGLGQFLVEGAAHSHGWGPRQPCYIGRITGPQSGGR
jgi:membrane protease YdiL (CAAX protease family)